MQPFGPCRKQENVVLGAAEKDDRPTGLDWREAGVYSQASGCQKADSGLDGAIRPIAFGVARWYVLGRAQSHSGNSG